MIDRRILKALIRKESYQILRDPSTLIIAFLLPLILLLIYRYAINMDTTRISFGIVNADHTPNTEILISAFDKSRYITAKPYDTESAAYKDLVASKIKGIVTIPSDFSVKLSRGEKPSIFVTADGSEPNTANFVNNYATLLIQEWLASPPYTRQAQSSIQTESRFWFNQNMNSHYFILPGSLAITMSLIGILLTALVIAREWERGTMEALLSMRISKLTFLLGKYIPYFLLGMASMTFCIFSCVVIFGIPFQGSLLVLFGFSALFLFASLGMGFFISAKLKDQFLSSQAAIVIGFLPALLLSGLLFPIRSMTLFFQYFTMILPQRYFVTLIQNEFMCGTIWSIVWRDSLFLLVLGLLLFWAVYRQIPERLD